jgi:NAD(P)-dependent dehydrogenase (short-subunit alcohol dehydrogenase family)
MSISAPPSISRAALVTGSSKRLGRDIALALAADGWDIAIHSRKANGAAEAVCQEIRQRGRQACCVHGDLRQPDQVDHLFTQAVNALPQLCAVVNNASEFVFDRPEQVDVPLLNAHYQSNVIAPVMLTQRLHAHLTPRHTAGQDPIGVVINLLDQKLANPNPDFFSYTLSKSALLEATRLAAMALAPVLRVVGVAPGITLPSADQTPEEFNQTHTMTPLGASSRASEVADAVVWLAQARAVTGTMLLVDGGQHLLAQSRDVMMTTRL